MYPNPQIYNNLKCIFVHIPKTAGTSIEQCLKDSNDVDQIVGGHTTCQALIHYKKTEFCNMFSFAIVRNPYDRLLSAYKYMLKMETNDILGNEPIKECKDFKDFVMNYLTPETISNMHLRPQYEFVTYNGEICVDYWGKYEQLDSVWKVICKKIKKEIKLPWLNKSNSEPYYSFYDDEMREKVKRLYLKDFLYFKY